MRFAAFLATVVVGMPAAHAEAFVSAEPVAKPRQRPAKVKRRQARTITWSTTATAFRSAQGKTHRFLCTARAGAIGRVWGRGPYTDDSSICQAAVHAGVLDPARGGVVRIVIRPGRGGYSAAFRHGVRTLSYRAWPGSFQVVGTLYPPEPAQKAGAGGWRADAVTLRGRHGARQVFACPPRGKLGRVWGTNFYTDDSSVCSAAVHAGLITPAYGGRVRIEILPGDPKYAGTRRNGVTSQSWGRWRGSFRFIR